MSKFILSAFADEIDEDLKIQMDVLEQHGISYIEMRGVYGKGVVEYSLEEVKEIKKELDDRDFKVSAIGSPNGKILITDDFNHHLQLFEHTLEIAKILETRYIRMFSFFIPEGEKPDKYREAVLERWKKFINVAHGLGIILLHENEVGIYGNNIERCLDLHKTLNCSYLRMTFDPGNFLLAGVENCFEAYTALKEYIGYIHAKDALLHEGRFVPSGEGDGRMKEIFDDLDVNGYEGFVSIEPHLQGNVPGGGPELFGAACNALKKLL